MTHRDDYERRERERAESAIDIREKLITTFEDYAVQAEQRREWEAVTAYRTAASLVLGTYAKLGEPKVDR